MNSAVGSTGPTGAASFAGAGTLGVTLGVTGPTGAASFAGVGTLGVTGPTGAASFAGAGTLGVTLGVTGPMGAASFAGVGSFVSPTGLASGSGAASAVAQIEGGLLTDKADAILQPTGVPRRAELLLCIFIRPEHQKERLARYKERFEIWTREFSPRTARRLYWLHAVQSIFDMVKIAVIGAVLDWIYDRFSGKP